VDPMEVAGDPAAAKLRLYEALVAEEGAPRGEPDVRWAKYWEALGAFLHGGLTKFELEAVVAKTIGTQHVQMHNSLILAIIRKTVATSCPFGEEGAGAESAASPHQGV